MLSPYTGLRSSSGLLAAERFLPFVFLSMSREHSSFLPLGFQSSDLGVIGVVCEFSFLETFGSDSPPNSCCPFLFLGVLERLGKVVWEEPVGKGMLLDSTFCFPRVSWKGFVT